MTGFGVGVAGCAGVGFGGFAIPWASVAYL